MAAKKDKLGIEELRNDIHQLQESFSRFRDAMLTEAAVQQAEQSKSQLAFEGLDLPALSHADIANAAAMMAAVGHPVRLHMVIVLAQNPASASELVDQLALGTTGTAYHHLNVLMTQGLVAQPQRGVFQLTADATPRVRQLLGGLFGASEEKSGKKSKKKKD